MRVTENANYSTMLENIHRGKSKLEDLQTQSATLKKMNRPSDDPVGAAKVLEVRTDKVNNEQFQMNSKLANSFLLNTDHAVEDLSEIVVRAKEIAVGQASGASSTKESRRGVAEEVSQLFQRAVSTANRRIGDRYLFGGYKNQSSPVSADGRYLGDDGEIMIEVAKEVYLGMNVPGHHVFNTNVKASLDQKNLQQKQQGPARTLASESPSQDEGESVSMGAQNVNLFQELNALKIALNTGDLDAIRGTLERFDEMHGQLISVRSKISARVNSLEGTLSAMERHSLTNAQLTSQIEDADMAQVMSDLAKQETVYRNSLASSRHLVQPTLLDFLK